MEFIGLQKSGSGKLPRMLLSLQELCVQHLRNTTTPQVYANALKQISVEQAQQIKEKYPDFLPSALVIVTETDLKELQRQRPALFQELIKEVRDNKNKTGDRHTMKERALGIELSTENVIITDPLKVLDFMSKRNSKGKQRRHTI